MTRSTCNNRRRLREGHVSPDHHVYRFQVLEFTIPGVTYHVLLAILSPHIFVDTYQITLQITYPRYIYSWSIMKNHCPVYTLQLQQLLQFLNYLPSIMPRSTRTARRGRRPSDETPPPTCPHCGNDGHISSLCPRTSYSTSAPALTCRSCVHKVQSAKEGDAPYGILHLIIPCSDHSTTTNPPRDTSDGAAPTQDASVTDPSPPQALQTTPSDAEPPVQPSTSISIPHRRMPATVP